MKRPIGLAALTVPELPPAEQVSLAAEWVCELVDLRLVRASADEQLQPWHEERFPHEIASRLSDCGLAAP
jgi:hypothetical protein